MGEIPLMTDQRLVHHQRHRARHRLAAAPLARRVLRARPRQDALLRQAAVLGPRDSVPRLVARLRVRPEGLPVLPRRPPPQDAGDDAAQGDRPDARGDPRAVLRRSTRSTWRRRARARARAGAPARRDRALRHHRQGRQGHRRRRTSASPRATSASWTTAASRRSPCRTTTSSAARSRRNIVDTDTGEILAKANDEITEELLDKLLDAGVPTIQTIYTNDLDQGPYISQTLRTDDTPDQIAAQVAIYRMMRPGEPPTEDAVEALFHGLFFSEERYDLSAVGRMKFNRRVGRARARRAPIDADQRRHHRRHQDPRRAAQRPRRDRRHRPPRQPPRALGRRTGREPVPRRPGARRARGQGAPRPGRERQPDAARPDQRQADLGGDQGVLRLARSCRSSWTRPTRCPRSRTSVASRRWARAA